MASAQFLSNIGGWMQTVGGCRQHEPQPSDRSGDRRGALCGDQRQRVVLGDGRVPAETRSGARGHREALRGSSRQTPDRCSEFVFMGGRRRSTPHTRAVRRRLVGRASSPARTCQPPGRASAHGDRRHDRSKTAADNHPLAGVPPERHDRMRLRPSADVNRQLSPQPPAAPAARFVQEQLAPKPLSTPLLSRTPSDTPGPVGVASRALRPRSGIRRCLRTLLKPDTRGHEAVPGSHMRAIMNGVSARACGSTCS